MLYEMIPEKLQRFVFYPWLGQFFSETDSIECYWNFIDRVFDGIPYSYDEVGTYGPSSAPRSAVYDYITSKFNLVDNIRYDFGDFGFPLLEEFIETTYYKGTAYVDDQGEITEVFPEGEDEFSNYVFDHTEKCGYIIHFYMKDLHKYLLDEKKPYNPDSYCEEVGEILQIVNGKDFPLRREYDSVRRYFL